MLALSCTIPTREPEVRVGPCPGLGEMKPPLRPFCGAGRHKSRYLGKVHKAMLDSLGFPAPKRVKGLIAISYREGPAVESVCWSRFGNQLGEAELVDLAKRVSRVRVPRQLTCFEDHRLLFELLEEWDGPYPELPPGWRRM